MGWATSGSERYHPKPRKNRKAHLTSARRRFPKARSRATASRRRCSFSRRSASHSRRHSSRRIALIRILASASASRSFSKTESDPSSEGGEPTKVGCPSGKSASMRQPSGPKKTPTNIPSWVGRFLTEAIHAPNPPNDNQTTTKKTTLATSKLDCHSRRAPAQSIKIAA